MLYGAAVVARNLLFDVGIRKPREAGIPVVSVGNLTVGGTGKTPFVLFLAREALRHGLRPAVVLRGYRGGTAGSDEARLLETGLPGAPVLVDPDRVRAARRAATEGADLVLLDDGFQHRRIRRHVDLVLLDARRPFGNGALLPAGTLREPVPSLRRASAVVLTRCGRISPPELEATRRFLERRFRRPVIACDHVPVALDEEGVGRAPTEIAGRRVLSFSGIGDPLALSETLTRLGARVEEAMDFGDHHPYSPADLERIHRRARELAVDWVVTTEKDRARLPGGARFDPARFGVLVVEVRPMERRDARRLAELLPFPIRWEESGAS